jgi:FtsH-binding integral membrane protein
MYESQAPGYAPTLTRDQTATLFSQVMWLVAATAGVFALGSYLGRNLSSGWAIVAIILGFGCIIAMNFTRHLSEPVQLALLAGMGLFLGLAMGPGLAYLSSIDPRAVWQAAGATALFMAGFGTAGYLTKRDLSMLGRISFFALIALILFGIVLIFIHIPHADLLYSILGLIVFAGLTMFDFQRVRRSKGIASAPMLAAAIFLDALNVFLFFLRIFSGGRD